MSTFLEADGGFPDCPGCGHPHVLRALDDALTTLDVPSHRLALVTDIGCVGLADAYFPSLHTVHALHGRACALATGMQLGEAPNGEDALKPIVLVGDGGATLGLLHLVHAAQLDVDVTVIVHNNLVYGMTGGQHSGFTPEGMRTTTTPNGNAAPPLDIGAVLAGAGCSFFARCRAPGDDLVPTLLEALRHPGFSCVEVLELCPTFASRIGGMTGKALTAHALDLGIVRRPRGERPAAPASSTAPPPRDGVVPHPEWRRLDRPARLVVAGRAGERVQAAAKFVAAAGCAAGLHATVRTDNPVTQGRGFSVAEVTLSPESIHYTGLVEPDLVVITAPEGLAELMRRGPFAAITARARVVADRTASPSNAETSRNDGPDLRGRYGGRSAALGALVEAVHDEGWWAPAAFEAALDVLPATIAADTRRVLVKAGVLAPVPGKPDTPPVSTPSG